MTGTFYQRDGRITSAATDASITGAVERAIQVIAGNAKPLVTLTKEEADALVAERDAAIQRAEAAERRAYDLAVAIMGGEDAPGYVDSIPTQALIDQQREMVCEWMGAVPHTVARTQAAAAWIAGRDAVLGDGNHWDGDILKLPEAHRLTPPADLSAALTARLDAAWNDAIEAADKAAIDRQGRRAMGDGHGNSCYDIGVSDAAAAIRALRRAAPTEGEV